MESGNPPVVHEVRYPETFHPGLVIAKLFLGWIYVGIPHGIILIFYGIASGIASLAAFVAILITGQYPENLFNFNMGFYRWSHRVSAYLNFMTDQYPPFTAEPVADSPVDIRIQRQESYSKSHALLKFFFGFFYAFIPHAVILLFYALAVSVTALIAFFTIVFKGQYPIELFRFAVGLERWNMRLDAYLSFMTEEYPPFNNRSEFNSQTT